MNEQLEKFREISPDLTHVGILKEPPGYDGWLVHLCYSNNKCADLQIDYGSSYLDTNEMKARCKTAIIEQLKHHEAIKD